MGWVYKLLVNIYIRIKHNVFRSVLFRVAVDHTEMGIADIGLFLKPTACKRSGYDAVNN